MPAENATIPERDVSGTSVEDQLAAAATNPTPNDDYDGEGAGAEQEQRQRPKSQRELEIERIEAKRMAELAAETGEQPEAAPDQPPAKPEAGAAPTEVDRQVQAAQLIDGDLSKFTVKRKVNGVEEVVTLDTIVRDAQKNAAADQRLREASEIKRQAEEALARAQAAQQQPQPTQPAPAAPTQGDGTDVEEQFFTSLYEGDQAKAREAFRAAVRQAIASSDGRGTGDGSAIQDIDTIVARVETQLSVKTALRDFNRDYPEIVGNTKLAMLADLTIADKVREGISMDRAIYEAGKEVAELIGLQPKGRSETGQPTGSVRNQEKLDAKRQITNLPTATARASAPEAAPESSEALRSQTIEEIARARGQRV